MLYNEKIKVTVQSSVGSKYGDYIPRYYETHNTEGWVKDALESEVDYWRSCQPVLLDAPTGCGKTTFVYDVLVKRVMEKGKNLLLISNRLGSVFLPRPPAARLEFPPRCRVPIP